MDNACHVTSTRNENTEKFLNEDQKLQASLTWGLNNSDRKLVKKFFDLLAGDAHFSYVFQVITGE
jgi:hypothetical protein